MTTTIETVPRCLCLDCGQHFHEDQLVPRRERHDGVHIETVLHCPYCNSSDVQDVRVCEGCDRVVDEGDEHLHLHEEAA